MSGMLVSLLCVFSLIAIRGLNLISCDACGKDSFILESGNNHTKEAQPATCGNREDLLYENIANITFNQSSTLPALPEHIWIEVSSHQVDYISIEFLDTLINATTASSILVADQVSDILSVLGNYIGTITFYWFAMVFSVLIIRKLRMLCDYIVNGTIIGGRVSCSIFILLLQIFPKECLLLWMFAIVPVWTMHMKVDGGALTKFVIP